jgi:hypothetical protein
MHRGHSPGAPTGNRNAWKHGFYSTAAIAKRRIASELIRSSKEVVKDIERIVDLRGVLPARRK